VSPFDLPATALVLATIGLAALAASWIPAVRASPVDPLVALHH
jgi:ABC-type lipoprotein release transport system permease subunit